MGCLSLTRRKILFWTILIVAQFVFIEIGTRVLHAFRFGPGILFYGTERRTMVVDPPPHNIGRAAKRSAGYIKYFPNERKVDYKPETGEAFSVVMNSRGFRGEDFTEEKPPGVTRIVTLGSSSTFGYRSKDDETYPFYVEEILNRQFPNKRFEVINLGIPHLKSAQILALFYAEGLKLNPDIVTFYDGINDSGTLGAVEAVPDNNLPEVYRKTLRDRIESVEWLKPIYRGIRNISLAVFFVDSTLNASPTHDKSAVEKYLAERNRYVLANISAIRDECVRRGIEFIVVSQQAQSLSLKNLKGVTYDAEAEIVRNKLATGQRLRFYEVAFLRHHALNQEIRAWVASNYVRFVDAIAALDQDRDVLLSWVHLSPRGNRLIAEAIAREISVAISEASTG